MDAPFDRHLSHLRTKCGSYPHDSAQVFTQASRLLAMGAPRRKTFNGRSAAVERQLIGSPAASAAGLSDQFTANKSNFAELSIPHRSPQYEIAVHRSPPAEPYLHPRSVSRRPSTTVPTENWKRITQRRGTGLLDTFLPAADNPCNYVDSLAEVSRNPTGWQYPTHACLA